VEGRLCLAWLFWFCEALALCVGTKPNVPNALAKNPVRWLFLFFLCCSRVVFGRVSAVG